MARMSAAAALVALSDRVSGRSSPPLPTGVAAPMLVLGAITATCAAAVMKVPAEAACAPRGETKTTVGTVALSRDSDILRVEERRPPGVFNRMITTSACSSSPFSTVRVM